MRPEDSQEDELRGIFLVARGLGDGLEKLLEWPVLILSVLMTAAVLLGVFFRYVLRIPLGWSEEFARYIMIWMALLSVALCIWRHEHVGVTIFVKKLPFRVAKTLIFVSNGLVFYFLWILTKYGFRMAEGGRAQIATGLNTTMYWWLMAVPVSSLFCIVMLACKMTIDIRRDSLEEILMSEEVVDVVRREEHLDF